MLNFLSFDGEISGTSVQNEGGKLNVCFAKLNILRSLPPSTRNLLYLSKAYCSLENRDDCFQQNRMKGHLTVDGKKVNQKKQKQKKKDKDKPVRAKTQISQIEALYKYKGDVPKDCLLFGASRLE